jgi:N-acetyl-anhydromuramyl-L-alanine amidase AmpD
MTIQTGDFNFIKRKSKKTQIVLCDTLRPTKYYLQYLRNRGKDKPPHFIVSKNGEVNSLYPAEYYSNYFENKNAIVIALENLGWLQKCTISPIYLNWIGDVFRGQPHVSIWKDHFFWDPYTNQQINSLGNLINELCEKYSIEKKIYSDCIATIITPTIPGVISRSKYDVFYMDINPSFKWEELESFIYT